MTRYPSPQRRAPANPYGQPVRRPRRYPKPSVNLGTILTIVLGLVTVGFLIGTMVFWNLRINAETRRDKKRLANNELKEVVAGHRRTRDHWTDQIRRLGQDEGEPPEGAQHWKNKYLEMARIADQWASQAVMWNDRLPENDKEWGYKNQHVFVKDDTVKEDGDDDGRLFVKFLVENRSPRNLRGLVGRVRFYQAGKKVEDVPFVVEAIDRETTQEIRVYIPESVTGAYVVYGSIKASGH